MGGTTRQGSILRAREEAGERPVDAIADYTRVIELAPRFDLAYLYRAELYDEIGRYDAAFLDFQRAIELSPSLGEAHRLFAIHDRDYRSRVSADFRVRKAIELDDCDGAFEVHNVDCNQNYYILGVLQEGYYDLAAPISTALQAVRFWPAAPEPYCLLANLYERTGDLARAVENARIYLEFPEEDRYPNCEPDARRIASGNALTPTPKDPVEVTPGEPIPSTGPGDCIDFDATTACTPL